MNSQSIVSSSINLTGGIGEMRYAIAWLLGVPASIIVIWFVLGHVL